MFSKKQVLKHVVGWLVKTWKLLAMFIGSSILFLALLLVVAVLAFSDKADDQTQNLSKRVVYKGSEQEIAVVRLTGEITSATNDFFWGFNSFAINPRQVQRLVSNLTYLEQVEAVLLVINSPGGSVAASEEIYQQLKLLSKVKPVYAYFEELGASGGYYIALPSKKIYASIPTITGSIGVIAYDPDFSGLMEKTGIRLNTYQSGPLKDLGSPTRSSTEQEKEIFNSIISDTYLLFVDRIQEHRNLSREEIIQLADGRIYSGKQAAENGLVDEIGSFTQVLSMVAEDLNLDQPTVSEYSLEVSFWSGLMSSSVERVLPSSLFNKGMINSVTGLYFY